MAVTAKKLSQSGARGKDLDAIIREQIRIIDDKLLHADKYWGWNVVSCELPETILGVPGLDKKDAQRIVYCGILRSLLRRGFEVRLRLEAKRTILYVAWMTDLAASEVEAMNALIRAVIIQPAELPTFLDHGRIQAPQAATAVRKGLAPPAPPLRVAGADQEMLPRGGVRLAEGGGTRAAPAAAGAAEAALLGAAPERPPVAS